MTYYDDDRHRLPKTAVCWICERPAASELQERIDGFADRPSRYPLCLGCLGTFRQWLRAQRHRD